MFHQPTVVLLHPQQISDQKKQQDKGLSWRSEGKKEVQVRRPWKPDSKCGPGVFPIEQVRSFPFKREEEGSYQKHFGGEKIEGLPPLFSLPRWNDMSHGQGLMAHPFGVDREVFGAYYREAAGALFADRCSRLANAAPYMPSPGRYVFTFAARATWLAIISATLSAVDELIFFNLAVLVFSFWCMRARWWL